MSRLTATDRLARLLAVIPWVAQRDAVPIDEVSRRFDYPRDELVRDLGEVVFMVGVHPFTPDTLIEVEIDDEDRVAIRYATWFAKPLSLSRDQRVALLLAGRALLDLDAAAEARGVDDREPGAADDEAAGPLLRAIAKLELAGGLADGALELRLGTPPTDVLTALRDAVEHRRAVRIDHYSFSRDERRVRVVEPWRVFSSEGHWYVAGWCRRAEGERVFRVDRIESAEVLDERIDPHPFPSGDDGSAVIDTVADPSRPRLVIEVDRDDAWIAAWYPIDTVRESGDRIEITLPVTGPAFVERLLVRLGPSVRVVSAPDGWGTELARAAAGRILRRYAHPTTRSSG